MPQSTAFLLNHLEEDFKEALRLAGLAESSKDFLQTNRLYIYEAAYLMAFCAWERFLEELFIRMISGYGHSGALGPDNPPIFNLGKAKQPNLAASQLALYNGKQFMLWHNPKYPIKISQIWFNAARPESIILSALSEIEDFAAIRHYIAHRSKESGVGFDLAITRLSGAGVLGNRAGRFLRKEILNPATGIYTSWLELILDTLKKYAGQIA